MIVERFAVAPAVSASWEYMNRGGYILAYALLIVVGTIDGWHEVVVVAEGNEGPWGDSCHLKVVAEKVFKLLLGLGASTGS